MKPQIALTILILTALSSCAQKKDNDIETPQNLNYKLEEVVPNLQNPWGMTFLPDGSILITEKSGQLIHFKDRQKTTIQNVPDIHVNGQGGLLDIELHPNYSQNGWIYFSYASDEGSGNGGNTALARAKLSGNSLTNFQQLYKASPNSTAAQHFGSRIEFDNDGYVYFTIGDRGSRDINPQSLERDGGKVYRLNDDGTIPNDNPFVNEPNAKTAIYSYGHRNPQGMAKHPTTGKIWTHEHGPRGGDEINIIGKGKNYGWPIITYGTNYDGSIITENTSMPGMEQPLHYWTPSIAPCGMTFVTSDKYPDWQGSLLVGSLVFQYLERLEIQNNQVTKREKLFENVGRLRNVRQAPDGFIYIAVEGKGIFRIVPE
jgi:glucose/arabinose dehydrogenase